MIKPPIIPWTPPIPAISPDVTTPDRTDTSSHGGSGSYGGSSPEQPEVTFESLFEELLQQYLPETVEFTPLSEEVLSETIRNWIRPAYEQAIQSRREQTQRINAELDADAWSRGMGQSTYLSDVKERQYQGEQRDVDTLESNYASALAGQLYDAMKAQQEKKIEVDEFNAEQINHARELAMKAARELYDAYLSAQSHGGGGGGGTRSTGDRKSFAEMALAGAADRLPKTDYRTAEELIARMSPKERARLYNRTDPKYLKLRSELSYSLGSGGLSSLMRKYPAR
jgi:hypothetical protein